jgi:hypothetical protein
MDAGDECLKDVEEILVALNGKSPYLVLLILVLSNTATILLYEKTIGQGKNRGGSPSAWRAS